MPAIRRHTPLSAGCLVLLGVVLLCAGLALAWFLGVKSISRAGEVGKWEVVPCTIQKLEVSVDLSHRDPGFGTEASYQYSLGGKSYTGTRVFDDSPPGDVNEIEEQLHAVRSAKPQPSCYVNPASPEEALLVPPAEGKGYALLIGGLALALVGFLVMLAPLFRGQGKTRGGALTGFVLCVVFAVAGGACLWFAMRNDWKSISQRMKSVPCTVIHSSVKEKSGSKGGRTYRPNILFRYEWEGRAWHSAWSDFSKNAYSTSSRGSSEDIVRRHPAGSQQQCWVDPERPWLAVLEKTNRGGWLLWTLGAVFGGIGGLGLLFFAVKILFAGVLLRGGRRV